MTLSFWAKTSMDTLPYWSTILGHTPTYSQTSTSTATIYSQAKGPYSLWAIFESPKICWTYQGSCWWQTVVQCPLAHLALAQGCGGVTLHPGSLKDEVRVPSRAEEHSDPGTACPICFAEALVPSTRVCLCTLLCTSIKHSLLCYLSFTLQPLVSLVTL